MSDDADFLSRWSRRKIDARAGKTLAAGTHPVPLSPPQDGVPIPAQETAPLPPVDSLTPESDFMPFMKADVDPALKRDALKVLMRDARFNLMDGLDVYIDDYSKPDPLPEEWLGQLNMMKRLGSFVEEPEEAEKAEAEPLEGLCGPIPEHPFATQTERPSFATEKDNAANNDVTESGIAGGKLPRNEA